MVYRSQDPNRKNGRSEVAIAPHGRGRLGRDRRLRLRLRLRGRGRRGVQEGELPLLDLGCDGWDKDVNIKICRYTAM